MMWYPSCDFYHQDPHEVTFHPSFCMLNSCLLTLPITASMSVLSFQKLNLRIRWWLEADGAGWDVRCQGSCSGGLYAVRCSGQQMKWGQGWGTVSWGRGRGCSYVVWAWRMCYVMGRPRCGSKGSAMWHLEVEMLNHVKQVLLKPQERFSYFCVLREDVWGEDLFYFCPCPWSPLCCTVGEAGEQNVCLGVFA